MFVYFHSSTIPTFGKNNLPHSSSSLSCSSLIFNIFFSSFTPMLESNVTKRTQSSSWSNGMCFIRKRREVWIVRVVVIQERWREMLFPSGCFSERPSFEPNFLDSKLNHNCMNTTNPLFRFVFYFDNITYVSLASSLLRFWCFFSFCKYCQKMNEVVVSSICISTVLARYYLTST